MVIDIAPIHISNGPIDNIFYEFEYNINLMISEYEFINEASLNEAGKIDFKALIGKAKNAIKDLYEKIVSKIRELMMKVTEDLKIAIHNRTKLYNISDDEIINIAKEQIESSTYYDYFVGNRDGGNMLVFMKKIAPEFTSTRISENEFMKKFEVSKEDFIKEDINTYPAIIRSNPQKLTTQYISSAKDGMNAAIDFLDKLSKQDKDTDPEVKDDINSMIVSNILSCYNACMKARIKDQIFTLNIYKKVWKLGNK